MENRLKEFERRKNAIFNKADEASKKVIQCDSLLGNLPGSSSILPFCLPFDNASLFLKKDIESRRKNTTIFFRSDFVEERRLLETSSDVRISTAPFLEQFVEYVFSEIEKKFNIDPNKEVIEIPSSCHAKEIDDHCQWCIDSSACRYGQPDGPEDYINDCDCYFEQE